MTVSHWDRLPDNLKGLVYQFDSTAKIKFQLVLDELDLKFGKAQTVKYYHRYRPSTDMDYRFILSKIQIRRKSKVSKYYVKKTHAMLLSLCYLKPREFNERAQLFKEKSREVVNRWKHLVKRYPAYVNHFARCMKKWIPIYKRILN